MTKPLAFPAPDAVEIAIDWVAVRRFHQSRTGCAHACSHGEAFADRRLRFARRLRDRAA